MIILMEGLDGSGKSTACQFLANYFGALLYATPPEKFRVKREQVDRFATNEDHYDFYRRAVVAASDELRLLTRRHPLIVIDRYMPTTLAYHRACGVDAQVEDFGDIIMPDQTIYVSVPPHVCRERMLKRGMSACDIRDESRLELVQAEYLHYFATQGNITVVENLDDETAFKDRILSLVPLVVI
jgi:thymidylate kinase